MKRWMILILLFVLTLSLSSCDNVVDINNQMIEDDTVEEFEDNYIEYSEDYGSLGALDNFDFTLEEMLYYALQDEYSAKAEYEYIMTTFDVTNPFENIRDSEIKHIDLLLPLFETHSIQLIEDTSENHLIAISSVQEAYEIGVIAEINNIAMYNLFLEQDNLPEDVKEVFVELRDASINHLSAFEKNAAK